MTTPLPDLAPTAGAPLTDLSVVIPVYDEETWIRRSVGAVLAAVDRAGVRAEVVVVDDGSTDGTAGVVDELAAADARVRRLSQPNSGRMAARTAGARAARNRWVLMLDSRVLVGEDSLAWMVENLPARPEATVWCGHVDVETRGNPTAAFWSGLAKVGWRRYFSRPRLVSFGADDFDLYPKGTTCLLLEREHFLELAASFDSLFESHHLASDDTRLLRRAAAERRIWLSPDFAFTYHGKSGVSGFRRQAYFRGTTFVDSYLGQSRLLGGLLVAATVSGAGLVALTVARPVLGVVGLGAVWALVPAVVAASGGKGAEVRAAAALTPAFVALFGAGVLRGFFLATRHALRSRGSRA